MSDQTTSIIFCFGTGELPLGLNRGNSVGRKNPAGTEALRTKTGETLFPSAANSFATY
ncbi:MAG: hypothetical protein NTX66_03960 [Candidatus Falkowbacteria bacterium]|nr:hypothetical protein [Candidatus Falkowbacteria bacterium]